MKILLDTCSFLWYISKDKKLHLETVAAIQNQETEVYLSPISVWESTVKYQLGKLTLPDLPGRYLPIQREKHQIFSLPLDEASIKHLTTLPSHHRDPFDRILICQAIEHNMVIATSDSLFSKYPVKTM